MRLLSCIGNSCRGMRGISAPQPAELSEFSFTCGTADVCQLIANQISFTSVPTQINVPGFVPGSNVPAFLRALTCKQEEFTCPPVAGTSLLSAFH